MKRLFVSIILLSLAACASSLTYRRAGESGLRPGYSDSRISANSYRVSYLADGQPSAYKGLMRRAAEIAKENGYAYFKLTDHASSVNFYLNEESATVVLIKKPESDSLSVADVSM